LKKALYYFKDIFTTNSFIDKDMRRFALGSLVMMIISLASVAQNKAVTKAAPSQVKAGSGYIIPITLTPYKNTWVY
jgi:hypothetical protein